MDSPLCVAVCCSVLQCNAVCCSALQCVAVCCSVTEKDYLLSVAASCVAVWCSMLQYGTVCCSVLRCDRDEQSAKKEVENFGGERK